MMLALLVTLVLLLLLLPLLPALQEWRWPTDVEPLRIDDDDALDPMHMAHRFGERLNQALQAGQILLGKTNIVRFRPTAAMWPLLGEEIAKRSSRRLWYLDGSAELPAGFDFLSEVAASDHLSTAPGRVYRALMAGGRLRLAPDCRVLRWLHGDEVAIGVDCLLGGRVTAERSMHIDAGTRFSFLHAPTIVFGRPGDAASSRSQPSGVFVIYAGLKHEMAQPFVRSRAADEAPLTIDSNHAWRGDLVRRGDVVMGCDCRTLGSIKTHGSLVLGPGCHVSGSLFARGEIVLGPGCVVLGCIASETAIRLESGCQVGSPEQASTVTAPRLDIAPAVRVHGTVWAEDCGCAVRLAKTAQIRGQSGIDIQPNVSVAEDAMRGAA